jgi:hypothetical protein
MIAHFKKITLAVALGASALAVAAPAQAQRYGGYRGRDNGGTAVIAGVAGLAIGAALASSANRRDEGDYYEQGYDAPVVVYPQVYGGYYESGYSGYDYQRGYNGYSGYNGYYSGHRGDYDRGRGYGERYEHRGYNDRGDHDRGDYGHGEYGHGGRDGYRR